MSMTKQPQAGEYWRMRNGDIAKVADVRSGYDWCIIGWIGDDWNTWRADGSDGGSLDLIEHLPDCTGFDWKPEPPKPQYVPFDLATVLRDAWYTPKESCSMHRIIGLSDSAAYLGGRWFTWDQLLTYTTIDGKPAGRKVE